MDKEARGTAAAPAAELAWVRVAGAGFGPFRGRMDRENGEEECIVKRQQGSGVGDRNGASREAMRALKTKSEAAVSERSRGVPKKRKSKREFCGVPPPGWTRGHINLSSYVLIDLRTIY